MSPAGSRLATAITLWPFEIVKAEYLTGAAAVQALIPGAGADCVACLRLQLAVRSAARPEDEPADKEAPGAARTSVLVLPASRRCASICSVRKRTPSPCTSSFSRIAAELYFRVLDWFGDPIVTPGEPGMIRQIGFDENEALIPNDNQLFRGFDFLRDYFAFPRRFLGFDMIGLGAVAGRLEAKTVDIVVAFDDVKPQLGAAIRKEFFALYAAPGANLFEKTLDRIPVRSNQYEFPVIPDRSRLLDFETNRVTRVFAHIPGAPQKVPVEPLYSAMASRSATGLSYTIRRLPRRRTIEEKKYGPVSNYAGADVFLSLGERSDPRRTSSRRRTQRRSPLHQPPPRGTPSGRRKRSRLSLPRRCRTRSCAAWRDRPRRASLT